jgi:hypothetical protein
MDPEISWYENPGTEGLRLGRRWRKYLLLDTHLTDNEWTELRDLDRDGSPELVVNSWGESKPFMAYRSPPRPGRQADLDRVAAPPGGKRTTGTASVLETSTAMDATTSSSATAGMSARPRTRLRIPGSGTPTGSFPRRARRCWCSTSVAMASNDIIWGHGHGYGLYWEERRDDNRDGSTNWRRHLIDDRISQAHGLVWEDIDRDGVPELITGRRVRAHSGNDPGDNEPGCIYYYRWDGSARKFTRHVVAENGPGIGLQLRLADLDGDRNKDIVVAGKSGTYVIWNRGL